MKGGKERAENAYFLRTASTKHMKLVLSILLKIKAEFPKAQFSHSLTDYAVEADIHRTSLGVPACCVMTSKLPRVSSGRMLEIVRS